MKIMKNIIHDFYMLYNKLFIYNNKVILKCLEKDVLCVYYFG